MGVNSQELLQVLLELKIKEIERNNTLKNLNKERSDLTNQINTISGKKEFPNGEILVKVDAKNSSNVSFELSYVVENAGWFPTYDIRAKNVNEPVELIYKANVKQDTKISWDNVKLNLSQNFQIKKLSEWQLSHVKELLER